MSFSSDSKCEDEMTLSQEHNEACDDSPTRKKESLPPSSPSSIPPFICLLPIDILIEVVAWTPIVWWTNFIRTCSDAYELFGRNEEIGSLLYASLSFRHESSRFLNHALKTHPSESHVLQGLHKYLRHAHTLEIRGLSSFTDASLRLLHSLAPNVSHLTLHNLSYLRGSVGAHDGPYSEAEEAASSNQDGNAPNKSNQENNGKSANPAPQDLLIASHPHDDVSITTSLDNEEPFNAFERFGTRLKSLTLATVGIRESSYARLFSRALTLNTGFWAHLERLEVSMGLIFDSLALLPLVAPSLRHLSLEGCWKLSTSDWDLFAAVLSAKEGPETKTFISRHFPFFASQLPSLLPAASQPSHPISIEEIAQCDLYRMMMLKPKIQLTSFSAKSSLHLTNDAFIAIMEYTGATLKVLSLKLNAKLRETALQAISQHCPLLSDLCIADLSPLINSSHWASFFDDTPSHPEIKEGDGEEEAPRPKRLFSAKNLTYLDVSGNINVDDEVVAKLTQGEGLKMDNLNLTCSSITDASLNAISDKYGYCLRYLDISGCQKLTRFDEMGRLKKLIRLSSAECRTLAFSSSPHRYGSVINDLEVATVRVAISKAQGAISSATTSSSPLALPLPSRSFYCIQKYDLSFTEIDDVELDLMVRDAIHLASLSLIGCSRLTNASLITITNLLRRKDYAAPFSAVGLCQVPLMDSQQIRLFKREFCPSSLLLHRGTALPDLFRSRERTSWDDDAEIEKEALETREDRVSIACARGGSCQSRFICQCHAAPKEPRGRIPRQQRRQEQPQING